ncbi:nSTAND1 domain-containing NTPase, partial [Nostoc sp.]
ELRSSTFEPDASTSELRSSTFEPDASTFDTQNPHSLLAASSLLPSADAMNRVSTNSLITQLRENEQRNLRTVLIFDQFEEFFFVYTEPAQRKQFFEFLGECLNVLSVKVILSLRVDYIHYLLECNDLPSLKIIGNDILSNNVLYKLGNFSPADANSIIQRLTENTSFRLEPILVEQLVVDLAGKLGEVRPIELQIVGAQLQTENITTLAEYQQRGTKDELVKRYLEEVVNDCGEENHQAAEILLYLLTDDKGTRPLKTRAELERDLMPYLSEIPPTPLKKGGFILSTPLKRRSPQAGGSEARGEQASEISKLDLVLEIVVQSGLVVLLPENPFDRYQLVHDYIAAFIRQQQEPKLKQVMGELEKEREQRKLSDAKLNSFLKRALFGSVAAGVVLAGLTFKAWDAAKTAEQETKQAAISEINALANSSATFSASGQIWDALTEGLKAGGKLKNSGKVAVDTQIRVVGSLQKAVYLQPENKFQELNTLEGHSSWVNSVVFSPDGQRLASASFDNTIIIWNLDLNKLVKDGCRLLNNYLVVHPEVLQELTECQTPPRLVQAATVLVIQGEKLARNEDVDNAITKFRQAQQWDANLRFEPQVKAQEFVNKGKAERSVDEGNSRLREKKFKEALAAYTAALKFDPKVEIPTNSWNTICWDGSLQKQAADVLPACDKAVALAPEDGRIRDSRGLARALTGDTQGAITDFEAYIAQPQDKNSKAQRQRWVKDLRAGKNPFTDAEIKKLRN